MYLNARDSIKASNTHLLLSEAAVCYNKSAGCRSWQANKTMPSWLAPLLSPFMAKGWNALATQSSSELFGQLTQVSYATHRKVTFSIRTALNLDAGRAEQQRTVWTAHTGGLCKTWFEYTCFKAVVALAVQSSSELCGQLIQMGLGAAGCTM
jgi:hypothetical protein